jgi:gamma-glutamyltranspeptidase/glutathione hydrolase
VRGWADALTQHGSISLADALAPAIEYAESGFAVSVRLASSIATGASLLAACPSAAASYLHADGRPYEAGERLSQPDLAHTLRAIAADGAESFYRGDIGQRLVRAQVEDGGRLSEADLARQVSTFSEPIAGRYRGYTILEQPPVSLGLALLEELAIVEGFDLAELAVDGPERAHLLIEAKKLAFADVEAHLTDPEFHDVPVPGLASADYAAERRALIDPGSASDGYGAGDPRRYGQHTSYLAVVDPNGNAVSWIQSIFERFGSGWMAEGTGFLLNDRMNGFSIDPDHVNRVEPGKRTAHTLNAPMVVRDGRPYLVFGTPGGYGQVQTNLQMLTAHLDHGLDIQSMVETPRWLSQEQQRVVIESRFPSATLAGLEARGHRLQVKGPWSSGMGDGQAIRIDQAAGVLQGAADPRREGYAIAW